MFCGRSRFSCCLLCAWCLLLCGLCCCLVVVWVAMLRLFVIGVLLFARLVCVWLCLTLSAVL